MISCLGKQSKFLAGPKTMICNIVSIRYRRISKADAEHAYMEPREEVKELHS